MQSTMNFNGLQRQGSQENYILDNALRKKCALWYRRSLRGNNDRHRQETGSLPRVNKVGINSGTACTGLENEVNSAHICKKKNA